MVAGVVWEEVELGFVGGIGLIDWIELGLLQLLEGYVVG